MPVVYFLVTGKSTDVMLHVGATSIGGDILVLDMLKEEHVREVRLHLQDGKKHSFPLQVMGLVEVNSRYLDACLPSASTASLHVARAALCLRV